MDVRVAAADDAAVVGQLLHDFNVEFDEPSPPPATLAERIRELITHDTVVLLTDPEPAGIAVLRFRQAIWTEGPECYLAELYVRPDERGKGLGHKLLTAVIDAARERQAGWIELNTATDDEAARHLYEKFGFSNTEGGSSNLYYELDLNDDG